MTQQYVVRGVATTISADNGYTVVTYHNTPVVKFSNDEIILNTGGYFTNTTKTRMNQAAHQFSLGYCVYQKKHRWFIEHKGNIIPFNSDIITLKVS